MWFGVLTGWLDRQEQDTLACLMEENRILRAQVGRGACASPMKTDSESQCERSIGVSGVTAVAAIVTPDAVDRQLVTLKWT